MQIGPFPEDENGWPERDYGLGSKPCVFNCQGSGGQRFEHLAAKRNWRESWFKHNVRLFGASESHSRANGQVPSFSAQYEKKIFWEGL